MPTFAGFNSDPLGKDNVNMVGKEKKEKRFSRAVFMLNLSRVGFFFFVQCAS